MSKNRDNPNDKEPSLGDLISLREASETSGLSQSHLSLLIRQRKLWGRKIGRNWVTTEQAVRDYLTLDRKPGPKPQRKP